MAIRMTIGVLVEALLLGGGGVAAQGSAAGKGGGNAKEWHRKKLKALALLLGRLGTKEAESLPGIIRAIISWILNRAKEVVGWISEILWALVVGIRGLLYQYALQWAKREIVELSFLSSWKEMVKSQIEERISKLKQNFKQPTGKVLQNVDMKACLSDLHNKYVFVPADKAPNNIIIICKRYYIETLIKELGLDNCSTPTGNSTYTSCQMSSEDIVNTHDTFMKSLGIELSDDDKRLPFLYWTPKLHKSPVKHRFIAGSSKCTTKQLSSLLTKILTVIKTGLEKYCSIKTSHS